MVGLLGLNRASRIVLFSEVFGAWEKGEAGLAA
jgi:hypothetical protein